MIARDRSPAGDELDPLQDLWQGPPAWPAQRRARALAYVGDQATRAVERVAGWRPAPRGRARAPPGPGPCRTPCWPPRTRRRAPSGGRALRAIRASLRPWAAPRWRGRDPRGQHGSSSLERRRPSAGQHRGDDRRRVRAHRRPASSADPSPDRGSRSWQDQPCTARAKSSDMATSALADPVMPSSTTNRPPPAPGRRAPPASALQEASARRTRASARPRRRANVSVPMIPSSGSTKQTLNRTSRTSCADRAEARARRSRRSRRSRETRSAARPR